MYLDIEFRNYIPGTDSITVNLLFKGDVCKM